MKRSKPQNFKSKTRKTKVNDKMISESQKHFNKLLIELNSKKGAV